MQSYQNQAKMAGHIADVAAASTDDVGIADTRLKEAAVKMRTSFHESLVLERYAACYSAFRQWSFPHAYVFLPTISRPDVLKRGVDLDVSEDLKKMLGIVDRYYNGILKEDARLEFNQFGGTDAVDLPFYRWSSSRFGESIAELLSGKPVALLADIRNSPASKDAIKFIRVGLGFKLGDSQRSAELETLLQNFKLSMRHSGASHYRVRQEYYTIQSTSVEIVCDLRTKADGSPVGRNAVYDKLLTGDRMLSPYALWTIELIKINPAANYESLSSFADLELNLVGEGWYIDAPRSTEDYELDKFGYTRTDFPMILT